MDRIGSIFGIKMRKSYSPVNTLDPNEQFAERMRHSRSSNGRLIRPLEPLAAHSQTINTMAVIRPGMVLSGGNDQLAALTNTDSGEIHQVWDNKTVINKLCYRSYVAKHALVTGNKDTTLSLLMFQSDGSSGPSAVFRGHEYPVTGVVNISESSIMSGSRDCTVRLWDLETKACIRSQKLNRNMVTHMTYNCARNLVAQTSEDKSLKLWDPRSASVAMEFPRKQHIQMYCEFGSDNRVFSCSNGFNGTGCEITSYDLNNPSVCRIVRGHEGSVTSMAVVQMEGGKKLLASVAADKHIRLWKIEDSGEDVLKYLSEEEVPLEADNLQVCTYPDGHIIVSGGKGRMIHYQAKLAAQRVILDVQLKQKPKGVGQSSSSHTIR